ncbi:acyl-CoA dehydrogenase [Ramlibacter henchirensis]|uniref:Acyl-CoA dehydrogenase n=1 Tax=Ramlibacter henchirensis TaxID=204072 RepID=A0A4Z0BWZ1_9BURK|nr:acyl-CoA dehydrogenase family protein [Ramlibacter henchirensis]TFZ02880.1 acyl-CoA dehydrogenase [Ramlibacter henchirensis]
MTESTGERPVADPSILALKDDLPAFRAALRAWLAHNTPRDWEERLARDFDTEFVSVQKDWLAALETIGLAVPHWPRQWGGPDLSIRLQVAIYQEFARANTPGLGMYSISHNLLPATLHDWGTPEQVARYMPAARQGEIWCQGFSEPGAGSDLASLRTRAVRDGDQYVINGQKIWSSGAKFAQFYMLLARTDPDAPRHKGISMLIVDLRSPGVQIRPIRQINGNAEFCEVFLDNVKVPVSNLIGPENGGWRVAQSTLSTERGLTILNCSERMQFLFERILEQVRAGRAPWYDDDQWRREFVRAYTDLQAVRQVVRQMLENVERTGAVGDTPLYVKLLYSEVQQRATELFLRIEGIEGQHLAMRHVRGYPTGSWLYDYVSSWAWTIAGGTNEVIRNIVAERQIGLPREPR